jgi:bla regulator protein blaR1
LLLSVAAIGTAILIAQSSETPDWQTTAGGKMAFEVASVKPSKIPQNPDFPMDASSNFSPRGRFSASLPLMVYINFAYKLTPPEQPAPEQPGSAVAHIPAWVRGDDFFAIEATAAGRPTKDQMRLMMQSLLVERFKLLAHFETREVPIFALTLLKPGKTGPKLLAHATGPACRGDAGTFPQGCGTPETRQTDGLRLVAARDLPMSSLANAIYLTGRMAGEIDRPVIDRTGLDGTFDFVIKFKPGEPFNSDSTVTPFLDALREQLGLKLVASKGPVRKLVIDRVERPSEN